MTAAVLPLMVHADAGAPVAHWRGRTVAAGEFLAQVRALAARLPAAPWAINLCEDRYLFLVTFAALLLRGQANLLPPNRAPRVVQEVAAAYPDCYCIVDGLQESLPLPQFVAEAAAGAAAAPYVVPQLPATQLAAILFTSGSTGQPQAHRKSWGDLVAGCAATRARFALDALRGGTVVATVPPQHMFGLELTVLVPLLAGIAVHGGRPFYPEDLRQALAEVAAPTLLVTTPLHLRACVEAALAWPAPALIVSATAPLTAELAQQAEQRFGGPLWEIYGSTETGAIASRRTVQGAAWRPLDGVTLRAEAETTLASAPFLPEPVALNDVIALAADGSFALLGRSADMLKVAGKRASLSDLNQQLLAIDGVEDGVLFLPQEQGAEVTRLCALVVAPTLSDGQLQAALLQRLDPVFVPRPIYRVERLPRSETGKLGREAVLALWRQMRGRHGTD